MSLLTAREVWQKSVSNVHLHPHLASVPAKLGPWGSSPFSPPPPPAPQVVLS